MTGRERFSGMRYLEDGKGRWTVEMDTGQGTYVIDMDRFLNGANRFPCGEGERYLELPDRIAVSMFVRKNARTEKEKGKE